ncbi:1-phosphofructokinase [Paenibacillus radicis (ex Xue et al. 2023)]|uniref:Tagatose-6-phosphate kinase n=1 Tax=Paenibacillus radicis (ex Xue et al. 2023) TaxID=2972489 RepID=A0ABT1YFE6_9BACL|nr:1-phosphofructokinase [Paenibacillus radicis (ex Xue et al. 2023)]MCR8631647.1 1-phosphofructokinase [Paenibacillus radicis (ex Xue et al. 2023)]
MITTVTLNAAIDKTYYVPLFTQKSVMRVQRFYAEAGGKGINVARVISQLGKPVLATGFAGGFNGRFIRQELDRQQIQHDFVEVAGESRLCLNIINELDGISTEILEPGPVISDTAMEQFTVKFKELAKRSVVVCISGSLPAGVPKDFYAKLVSLAKGEGAVVLLDTSGEALQRGAEAAPYLIKPNEQEAAQLIGKSVSDAREMIEQLVSMERMNIPCITISLGSEGSLAYVQGAYYRVKPPLIDAVNTVGCGDSFMAGMAVCIAEGRSIEESLRYATAVGSANALNEKAGYINKADVDELLKQVKVVQL